MNDSMQSRRSPAAESEASSEKRHGEKDNAFIVQTQG
jgi:hypothetical protein